MTPITTRRRGRGITFGLIFFSSSEAPFSGDMYRLVIESTRFADQHGFSSVWIPERHFTKDGWLYPNPAVLQAALARETRHIHLRAGSVVVPLHNPIRIAEEWAMVDNLSGGRVGISFASGWHPNDFVLYPENYAQRNEIMYQGIETVRKLWRGESVSVKAGDGNMVEIKTYPPPIQRELPFWVTAAGNPKTFAGACELGANLLTHMYNQSVDELAEKIRIYRESRAKHGYDPETGQVSVMLHTFVGSDMDTVRTQIQGPFCDYLRNASYLLNAIAYSRGQKIDLASLSEQDINDYLQFVLDRMISTQRVLFGTPETCLELVRQLKAAGVDEIACQMDFGVDVDLVLQSLPYLNQLKDLSNAEGPDGGNGNKERGSLPEASELVNGTPTSAPAYQQPSGSTFTAKAGDHKASDHNAGDHKGTPLLYNEPAGEAGKKAASSLLQDNQLASIQRRCQETVALPAFYERLHELGIQLAASFQGIEQLWRRDGEALGLVQLPADFEREANLYQVHPTLLDACFQVLTATLPDVLFSSEEVLFLPTGLRSFHLLKRPGNRVWSHAQLKPGINQDEGIFEGDVRILDETGQVLIEASGLQLHRSASAAQPASHTGLSDWLYELDWEARPLEKSGTITQPGQWLIFMDHQGVGQRLAELLRARGESCLSVLPGDTYQVTSQGQYYINPSQSEDVRQVIKNVLRTSTLRGVVHLWSLDTTPSEQTSVSSLEADQELGAGNALNLIQALINIGSTTPPRLWLATRGAQPVGAQLTPKGGTVGPLSVAQSPIWGLGKTCAMEHPEFWGGLIDLDPQGTVSEAAAQLVDVITGSHNEDQIAFRQGQSYVARMVRSRQWTPQKLDFCSDASYLITGGLWGLGLEVARWMMQKGAQHLVLMGRTKLPPRTSWDYVDSESRLARQIAGIRSLEALGAHVHYAPVDVANEAQLAAFLKEFAQQGNPPIRGVMHAASVWQDAQGQSLVRPLANLTTTALKEVFRPKVIGSWLLHSLLKDTQLDFFVSFSSGASLFGSAAQGNYAAAGEFLDVLAYYQRASGQPALSIDWGAVSEIGFGGTAEGQRVHEYWESRGIQRITPRQVLAALELLIPQKVSRVGVIKLDWHLLQQFYPQITGLPLVTHLVPEANGKSTVDPQRGHGKSGQTGTSNQETSGILQALLAASSAQRLQLLETYLSEQVAGVLRIPVERMDVSQPLTALGLDSLMAIELKNRIELELKIRIPIVTFLQGPSITQFVGQVLALIEEMADTEPVAEARLTPKGGMASLAESNGTIDQAEQLLAQLDQLSDEQVDALLGQMLENTNGQHTNGQDANGHTSEMLNGISPQEAEQLLTQLDQLSDEQVDALLGHIAQKEEPNR